MFIDARVSGRTVTQCSCAATNKSHHRGAENAENAEVRGFPPWLTQFLPALLLRSWTAFKVRSTKPVTPGWAARSLQGSRRSLRARRGAPGGAGAYQRRNPDSTPGNYDNVEFPSVFLKPPSSLTGHNTDINLAGLPTRGVYEPECAVIICRDMPRPR